MNAAYHNELVTCPLDPAHRILQSKLQTHVMKCLKVTGLGNKCICPFNPVHIVEKNQLEEHISQCESNANILISMNELTKKKNFSGEIPAAEAIDQVMKALAIFGESTEDYNAKHYIDGPAYDPIKANMDKPLYRSLNCESKSKRKGFRMQEIRRHTAQTDRIQSGGYRDDLQASQMQSALADSNNQDEDGNNHQGASFYDGQSSYDEKNLCDKVDNLDKIIESKKKFLNHKREEMKNKLDEVVQYRKKLQEEYHEIEKENARLFKKSGHKA